MPEQRSATTLPQLLAQAARDTSLGVTFPGGPSLTYAALRTHAVRIARELHARGVVPGDRVLVVTGEPEHAVHAFWGCVLGGAVPCPVAPPADSGRWRAQLEHLRTLLGEPLVVVDERARRDLPGIGLRTVTIEELRRYEDGEPDENGEPDEDGKPGRHGESGRGGESGGGEGPGTPESPGTEESSAAPDDLALLMLTSGSTGAGKAVRLTHANLLAAQAGKAGALDLEAGDTMLNWISADHIAAVEAHLLPMLVGASQIVTAPATVLADPLEFLRLVAAHRVRVTFTPNFLFGQINQALERQPVPPGELDLSQVRYIISGGEATVTATARAFLAALAPHGLRGDVIVPAFGMTETCAGSVFNRDFGARETDSEFPPLGRPVAGLRIRIVDGSGTVLAGTDRPGGQEPGEVQFRGTMVTDGYFGDTRATAEAFTPDGWFRTGDLGRLGPDGGLTLVGRTKDSVIVHGVNYYSHDLEAVLDDLDGIRRGQVAAFPVRPPGADSEQLAVAFVPADLAGGADEADQTGRAGGTDDAADTAVHRTIVAIRSSTVMHWGFRPQLVLPVTEADIPRGNLGKILRPRLRTAVEDGALDAAVRRSEELTMRFLGGWAAPEGDAETTLAGVYARILNVRAVPATAGFLDLGGTSLDLLRLKLEVQSAFGIDDVPLTVLLQNPTVRALAGRLTAGQGATGNAAYDPLVPLQVTGDGTPLFCVHPGLGEVLVFVNLAKYFTGERPFHALRARGFGPGETPFDSFDEMVSTYVAAIRRKQPNGPYAVAGYSYGGAVAFEIARRLEAGGDRVDFVGILNLPPHISGRMKEITFTDGAVNLALFLELVDPAATGELTASLRPLPQDEQLARIVARAPKQRLHELDLTLERFAQWVHVAQSMVHLGRDYEPRGTVEQVRVFYCTPLSGTRQEWLENQLRPWNGFARSAGRFIEVDGEHYTLMSPEHVQAFQAVFRRELALGLGAPGAVTTDGR